jgi:hypothetical protein
VSPYADLPMTSPRPAFAFARHFEQTRVVRAAIAPSGDLGDRYFHELAQRWQVEPTDIVMSSSLATKKLMIPVPHPKVTETSDEYDNIALDLLLLPAGQTDVHDRNTVLMNSELVIVLMDVGSANRTSTSDVEQLALMSPACAVLVVASHRDQFANVNPAELRAHFNHIPANTRFIVTHQDSRLSVLDLARSIEELTTSVAQHPAQPATSAHHSSVRTPAQGTYWEQSHYEPVYEQPVFEVMVPISSELVSALSSMNRDYEPNTQPQPSSSVPAVGTIESGVPKKKGRLRSALDKIANEI